MYTYCIVLYLLFQAAWPIKETNEQADRKTDKQKANIAS